MIVDCDTCIARGPHCADCVVTTVLGGCAELDRDERRALAVLAESGLVPPLRLLPPPERPQPHHQPRQPQEPRARPAV